VPQILGGAGPGLAQIPASIIWAGISVFELYYEAVRWGRSPLTLPPALMHVLFTLLSQLVGVSARFVMAVLALVPMERHGPLSDHAALQVGDTPSFARFNFHELCSGLFQLPAFILEKPGAGHLPKRCLVHAGARDESSEPATSFNLMPVATPRTARPPVAAATVPRWGFAEDVPGSTGHRRRA
jgi:hypothetical protein